MLEIRDLHFSYQSGERLLDGISFDAKPGDIIWLQGDNGSGKSTLLKIIAHLLEAEGEIKLHDRAATREELLQEVTYIPTEPYLFDYLTGEENIRFLQSLFTISAESSRQACEELINQFELTHAMDQHVQEYSLGMRHKLYWAAMFSRDSTVYVLDEPFSAFDTSSQHVAEEWLRLKAKQGAVILFVSHLHELSARLANRFFKLKSGILSETTRTDVLVHE